MNLAVSYTVIHQPCAAEGFSLIGPLPTDSIFLPQNIAKADAILVMDHDQGLPLIKHLGFNEAVNITLGLPFVRTLVDHDTALDLVGSNKASAKSFVVAIEAAIAICQNRLNKAS